MHIMRSFEPLPNIQIVLSPRFIVEIFRFEISETLIPVENSNSSTTILRKVTSF